MGAAHSASEEVRELEGKTGCEYRDGGRAPAARAGTVACMPPASRHRRVRCVTLGQWLALSVPRSPVGCFQWVPARCCAGDVPERGWRGDPPTGVEGWVGGGRR